MRDSGAPERVATTSGAREVRADTTGQRRLAPSSYIVEAERASAGEQQVEMR